MLFGITTKTANLLPTGTVVNIAAGAELDLNGADQEIGSLAGDAGSYLNLGGATLTTGNLDSSTTFAGTIFGSGNLTKTGTGTFTLSGANTNAGIVTVSAGTLQAGASGAFSPNSSFAVGSSGALDLNGFDQTIASLSGGGTVINSATAAVTNALTVGDDNSSSTFSGVLEDATSGDGKLALVKLGTGTFTITGPSTFTGPTTINGGTLEVDTNAIPSAVTINPGGTLAGTGGAGPVANLGGTYDPTLYLVTVLVSTLQDAGGTVSGGATISFPGPDVSVPGLSAADAANHAAALGGLADHFHYDPDYAVGGYEGPALVDDSGGTYNGDFFPISVIADTASPIAATDFFIDGIGGELDVDAGDGLLANDALQSGGTLAVVSVNGSATPGTLSTDHGSLTWYADGSFSYTPDTGFVGLDEFTYTASDGTSASNTTTVAINVVLPSIDLLDDANNDGTIDAGTDEPLKSSDPGKVILVSDDSGALRRMPTPPIWRKSISTCSTRSSPSFHTISRTGLWSLAPRSATAR